MRGFLGLLGLALTLVALGEASAPDTCNLKRTCGACIGSPDCVWCKQKGNQGDYQCQSSKTLQNGWCNGNVVDPQAEISKPADKPINVNVGSKIIQIQPQGIRIKTRPGKKNKFSFTYVQADDYPLDLYYLMDLSQSMNDDKDKLTELGNTLADRLQKKSTNLRMGFGSFVDKRTMPFVNTFRPDLVPCQDCAAAYSFKNHLALTKNINQFAPSVKKTPISGNIDYPEGGFDALMQVMVCPQIKWRNDSLHMIIFSTDAESHFAGDGKLGGIVEPNDEKCHLDATESYDHDLIQDYPSIGQISNVAKANKMNIIFAITDGVKETYGKLKDSIHRSQTGVLKGDSSNVVEFVVKAYDTLTQSVGIEHDAKGSLSLRFFSSCLTGGQLIETKECGDIKKRGDTVSFNVELTVNECPKDRKLWKQQFSINAQQSPNQKLVVELEMDCECDCEKEGSFQPNHPSCTGHGDLKCGTCVCQDNWWGTKCDCGTTTSSGSPNDADTTVCQQNANGDDDTVCNGRGECKCGECRCEQGFSGPFCECNRQNCPKSAEFNNIVCAGHGKCECHSCVCDAGWSGPKCECSERKDTCISPLGGEVCSGQGKCTCGSCECNAISGGGRFTGRYCDECPTCPGKCELLQQCVEVDVFHPEGVVRPNCANFTLHEVLELTDEAIAEALHSQHVLTKRSTPELDLGPSGEALPNPQPSATARLCSSPDTQGCTYYFKYQYDDSKLLHVFAKKKKECGEPVDILGVVLGLIGAIVLAGLVMLIIWKVATTIHDRREYTKFEKERQAAMWDAGHNPLYKEPASTFQNPTFSGR